MRQAHSNDIPTAFEYIGLGQWAVRWDVQVDTTKPDNEGISYVYNEEILDEENALKSNMISASLITDNSKSVEILMEWEEFEAVRNKAKEFGRQIFNI